MMEAVIYGSKTYELMVMVFILYCFGDLIFFGRLGLGSFPSDNHETGKFLETKMALALTRDRKNAPRLKSAIVAGDCRDVVDAIKEGDGACLCSGFWGSARLSFLRKAIIGRIDATCEKHECGKLRKQIRLRFLTGKQVRFGYLMPFSGLAELTASRLRLR